MLDNANSVQVVAGTPETADQISVGDFAAQLVGDPNAFFAQDNPNTAANESMKVSDHVTSIDPNTEGTTIDADASKYQIDTDGLNVGASTVATSDIAQVSAVDSRTATTYDANMSYNDVAAQDMTAATGSVSDGAFIDASETAQVDLDATEAGNTALGKSLNSYASQSFTNVIDTSTVAGKLLAQELGEGNYTDYKATVVGQMEILSKQFEDPNTGAPTIPTWAAGVARQVSRIASFKGMTGTAATAAMSQALLEASIPIAQSDAAFFQTLTVENLNNRQEATINKANVLSKLELANLDNRMAAAVQNSNNFMQMDLANLANEQQSRVINTQSRVQAILEDSKAINTQRMFTAQSQNEMDMFYSELNTQIEQFNAGQYNSMTQFNTSQENSVKMFNAELESSREQFYQNMQFNIDTANAAWRQTVTLTENQQAFEAAAIDVKNLVDVGIEQLNQIWDRSDSLLDYIWQSSEKELDRELSLVLQKLKSEADVAAADAAGEGSIWGSIAGVATSWALKEWL